MRPDLSSVCRGGEVSAGVSSFLSGPFPAALCGGLSVYSEGAPAHGSDLHLVALHQGTPLCNHPALCPLPALNVAPTHVQAKRLGVTGFASDLALDAGQGSIHVRIDGGWACSCPALCIPHRLQIAVHG